MISDRPQEGLQSWLEAIPLPAIFIAVSQHIVGLNQRAARVLGPGTIGRHFITVLRQPDILDAIEGVMRDQTPRKALYLDHEDDIDLTFQANCSYVHMGAYEGVLICCEDRTFLERAAQTRRDFVANVSHELRTPLTAMIGFIETLQGPARNDSAARQRFLGIMQSEAARMERLVQDLLSLSRVESQERQRPTEKVDVGGLLSTTVNALTNLARETNVTLQLDQKASGMVLGDTDQLRQVFTNLIENAIKYGGADRQVQVSISMAEHDLSLRASAMVIEVTDQGPGIDKVHLPRLTERFYRADTHRSREMGGTGLGLAIVKHILNRHRGRLKIESAMGEGSTFRVILPRVVSPE